MELNKEFLEKSSDTLKLQYETTIQEIDKLNKEALQIKGALKWVNQTLKLLNKKDNK